MNQSGVHGVVCADARGLCVTGKRLTDRPYSIRL